MGVTGSVIAAAAGGAVVSKALNKPSAMPSAPAPTVMPTVNDESVKAARRRQIAEIQARSGRASTVLSDPAAKLGG